MARSVFDRVRDFVFGTGRKPDITPFNEAIQKMNDEGATPKSVHVAWKLWREYLKDSLWAMPIHRRLTTFMPYSYRTDLLGWISFLVENELIAQDDNGIVVLIKGEG